MFYESLIKLEKKNVKAVIKIPFSTRNEALAGFNRLLDMLDESHDDTLKVLDNFVGDDGMVKEESHVL
ncbi:MAG: hypothetical protein ACI3U2_06910 [Anaerovibrio sp.]